jgi:hypothetical protein
MPAALIKVRAGIGYRCSSPLSRPTSGAIAVWAVDLRWRQGGKVAPPVLIAELVQAAAATIDGRALLPRRRPPMSLAPPEGLYP